MLPVIILARDLDRELFLDLGSRDMDRASLVLDTVVPEWLIPPRTSSYEGGTIPNGVSSPETRRTTKKTTKAVDDFCQYIIEGQY